MPRSRPRWRSTRSVSVHAPGEIAESGQATTEGGVLEAQPLGHAPVGEPRRIESELGRTGEPEAERLRAGLLPDVERVDVGGQHDHAAVGLGAGAQGVDGVPPPRRGEGARSGRGGPCRSHQIAGVHHFDDAGSDEQRGEHERRRNEGEAAHEPRGEPRGTDDERHGREEPDPSLGQQTGVAEQASEEGERHERGQPPAEPGGGPCPGADEHDETHEGEEPGDPESVDDPRDARVGRTQARVAGEQEVARFLGCDRTGDPPPRGRDDRGETEDAGAHDRLPCALLRPPAQHGERAHHDRRVRTDLGLTRDRERTDDARGDQAADGRAPEHDRDAEDEQEQREVARIQGPFVRAARQRGRTPTRQTRCGRGCSRSCR